MSGRFGLLLELLRTEGPMAVRDRFLDRLAESRRRRSFRSVLPERIRARAVGAPVLNLLSGPPAPRFGGVEAQLLARLEEEAKLRPAALLYPWAGSWRLEVEAEGRRLATRLEGPVPDPGGTAPHPDAADTGAVIRRARALVGAHAVHAETALRLPLDALAELAADGLVLSVHDFALHCLRPHLVTEPIREPCSGCTDEEGCRARRLAAATLLQRAGAVIFPSRYLLRAHRSLFPEAAGDWRVIAPGLPARARPAGPRYSPLRRVAFIGGGDTHKGAGTFAELVDLARERGSDVEWWAFGAGDREGLRHLRRLGVRVRGYYRWGTLPSLLRRHRIGVALLLPRVPESFSLTYSECLLAGVPVVAFHTGALAERVVECGGLLVESHAGTPALLRVIEEALDTCSRDGEPDTPLATDAAQGHLELYRGL